MNQSRDKIIYAAAELMKQKSYRKISVAELCEKAGINRSTFYRNFEDIYDMVEKIPKELLRKLEEFGLDCFSVNSDASEEDMFSFLIGAISIKDTFLTFADKNGNYEIMSDLIRILIEKGKTLFDPDGEKGFNFIDIFGYSALIYFIFNFVNNGNILSDEFIQPLVSYSVQIYKHYGIEWKKNGEEYEK
ncbi:MAG: TetR/AcrR family transcriptional regulator [Acutalibacteraceae bacterium]